MDKIKIHLENFKCFEDNIFYLNNITFLTGANASGKSSCHVLKTVYSYFVSLIYVFHFLS